MKPKWTLQDIWLRIPPQAHGILLQKCSSTNAMYPEKTNNSAKDNFKPVSTVRLDSNSKTAIISSTGIA